MGISYDFYETLGAFPFKIVTKEESISICTDSDRTATKNPQLYINKEIGIISYNQIYSECSLFLLMLRSILFCNEKIITF